MDTIHPPMASMSANALAERAMLVSLRMSRWFPGKIDAKVSEEVAARYGMTKGKAGRYEKYIIPPNTPSYAAVRRAYNDLRSRYYWYTLPWAHRGEHILPAVLFTKFSDDMRKCVRAAEDATQLFCGEFPRLAELSIASSNGLITARDIPDNIRGCFGINLQVMPVPTAVDFRVQMASEDAERVKQQMQLGVDAQVREALAKAARDPYEKLYGHIKRVVERLSDPKQVKFNDSLVEGLRDICSMLPAWNLTGDPELEILRQDAERMIAGVAPDDLRKPGATRERVLSDARAMADKLAPRVADNALPATEADTVTREAAAIETAMGGMFRFVAGTED